MGQVDASSVAKHALRESSATSSHSRSSSNDSARSAASVHAPGPPTSMPLEWANSSVALSLPKGHSPILFFRICRAPPATQALPMGNYEDEGAGLRPDQFMYALVVTVAKLVYVYESVPAEQRRWQLLKELYVSDRQHVTDLDEQLYS